MVKAVTFFVIFIIVLAMFGRLRFPSIKNPLKKSRIEKAEKCTRCGAVKFDGIDCACKDKS